MRTIKLMADYECFPLWEASPGDVGNIDPDSLPVSEDLRVRLMSWAEKFDSTLNMNDPLNSGFADEEEEINFKKAGQELGEHLQEELGSEFVVIVKI